jgi:predicted flap endonuclease-1-like 5' DNA nuclease
MNAKYTNPIIDGLAKKTGVGPADVEKVLNELGLDRFYSAATAANGGPPSLDQAKLMFRLSRTSVIC